MTFQEGSGYTGTKDTMLHGGNPGTSYAEDPEITIDADDGGREAQGLLRFDGLLGSGTDQVPAGATIHSATLTVEYLVND